MAGLILVNPLVLAGNQGLDLTGSSQSDDSNDGATTDAMHMADCLQQPKRLPDLVPGPKFDKLFFPPKTKLLSEKSPLVISPQLSPGMIPPNACLTQADLMPRSPSLA